MYPVLFSLGKISMFTFGIFASLGFFFASFVIWKRARETHFSEEEIFDAILLVALSGVFGARLLYVLLHFPRFGFQLLNWFSIFRVPGMTFFGGLALGVVSLFFLARRKHWDFFEISDIFVTGIALGQAIGWLGAFFAGTGVGRESKIGLVFPGYETARLPTQLIWVVGALGLFIFLWRVEQRYRIFEWYRAGKVSAASGFLTFSYLVGLGVLATLVSLFTGARVYLTVPIELFTGVVTTSIGIGGLYIRSGRDLREDGRKMSDSFKRGVRNGFVSMKQLGRKLRAPLGRTKNKPFS
ncbi:MAG: hypothetical protein A2900_04585 [Candidatus Chisholmbacteria bacterium RIFCSPLOWO2_01_FULL_50_28]|uniref:Phosphatidylglycerol--prolipoprotein diacylglyceryl transferase n=1 Tax=Candidatus Chisholmbacteria bacterium RIFCSPHIGHO2_01_FULL_52_32 TaxID=1797591 RepID=A0A1G1VSG0_9BACT|nr:MAG: hypothetical protein A2786_02160 [Candidatus Chisholmbacteria bacterium RIFCSPHIGHO2_01_FULL_52_32]OGY20328.1 MAG: hypothetical protein A2900_04585 [Candidatus Chisholmbacteria bacterium RIFCSPLOWO2_01_FULL_50_28]